MAADLPSEVHLDGFRAEVYGRFITVTPPVSRSRIAGRYAGLFPGMLDCRRTKWISGEMLRARRSCTLRLIRLAICRPGPGSRCTAHLIAACETLTTATVFTPCSSGVSLLLTVSQIASTMPHGSASKTSVCPVPSQLRWVHWSLQCLHTAAAPTRPLSERD
jgi:hypothetical protein